MEAAARAGHDDDTLAGLAQCAAEERDGAIDAVIRKMLQDAARPN